MNSRPMVGDLSTDAKDIGKNRTWEGCLLSDRELLCDRCVKKGGGLLVGIAKR